MAQAHEAVGRARVEQRREARCSSSRNGVRAARHLALAKTGLAAKEISLRSSRCAMAAAPSASGKRAALAWNRANRLRQSLDMRAAPAGLRAPSRRKDRPLRNAASPRCSRPARPCRRMRVRFSPGSQVIAAHAEIKRGRGARIQREFGAAGLFAQVRRRKVEIGEGHRALELEHQVAREKNQGHVGLLGLDRRAGLAREAAVTKRMVAACCIGSCRISGFDGRWAGAAQDEIGGERLRHLLGHAVIADFGVEGTVALFDARAGAGDEIAWPRSGAGKARFPSGRRGWSLREWRKLPGRRAARDWISKPTSSTSTPFSLAQRTPSRRFSSYSPGGTWARASLAPTCQINRSGRAMATSVRMRSAAVAAVSPEAGRLRWSRQCPTAPFPAGISSTAG